MVNVMVVQMVDSIKEVMVILVGLTQIPAITIVSHAKLLVQDMAGMIVIIPVILMYIRQHTQLINIVDVLVHQIG